MPHQETDRGTLWSRWRRLHRLYVTIATEFVLEAPLCPELEQGLEVPSAEWDSAAESWFAEMDRRGVPYTRIDARRHCYDVAVREREYSLLFNRMSPSAYLRGTSHGIFHTLAYLDHQIAELG